MRKTRRTKRSWMADGGEVILPMASAGVPNRNSVPSAVTSPRSLREEMGDEHGNPPHSIEEASQ